MAQYILRFDLYKVDGLPIGPSQVDVKLKFGGERIKSDSKFLRDGSATFMQSFEEAKLALPQDDSQIPDIFINVYRKSLGAHDRVGFLRFRARDIMSEGARGFKNDVRWAMLTPDPTSSAYVKDELAGFILFRLDFGLLNDRPRGAREVLIEPKFRPWQFRFHIYQGESIPPKDSNGFADPYVVVNVGGRKGKTAVKKECLNPVRFRERGGADGG